MLVYIRGAGDLASGIALRLFHSGMEVVMSDLPVPTSVRRTVCFSEAIRLGRTQVEDVTAVRADTKEEIMKALQESKIPVVPDPSGEICRSLPPNAEVDAIFAKKNLGTAITDAPVVIGVGPGFTAGADCTAVVETKRGHTLGRVIAEGSAIPNTGIPGNIGGYTTERVLRAGCAGVFHSLHAIGDLVTAGEPVAKVGDEVICAKIAGRIRGMLQDGIAVPAGMKLGDVDPRGEAAQYLTVSDKALAVGGGVLEALLRFGGALKK